MDLRRPTRTVFATLCLLSRDGRASYMSLRDTATMNESVVKSNPTVLAIGSPLTDDPRTGGSRGGEAALRKLEHGSCLNPRFAPRRTGGSIPLAERGCRVVRSLEGLSPQLRVIETHPAAVLEFLGLRRMGSGLEEGEILERAGIRVSGDTGRLVRRGRELNALLAAVTAHLNLRNETIAYGSDSDGGSIHLPRPRRVGLVVLDVDGTLTDVRSPWRHVHETLGLWRGRGEGILRRYLAGEISYDKFCDLDVGLWNAVGAELSGIERILDSITIRRQSVKLLSGLHAAGISIAMISTGFRRVAERIAHAAGLGGRVEIIANDLKVTGDGIGAQVKVSNDLGSRRSKGAHLRKLLSRLATPPIETLAVGDGPSDRELFKRSARSLLVERPEDLLKALAIALGTA
jgi:phosphoserine phosphatase